MNKHSLAIFLLSCTGFLLVCVDRGLAQDNSLQTFQGIEIERSAGPLPANRITLLPPTTAITPYEILWPALNPELGSAIIANSTIAPWQMDWTSSTGNVVQLVASSTRNLRRSPSILEPPSPSGTPGEDANDFQGSRTNGSQTASGNQSTILGGASNLASNNQSAVGGGFSNEVTNVNSVIVGGNNNTVTNTTAAILGGTDNTVTNPASLIWGGATNSVTNNPGVIGAGQNNVVSNPNGAIGGGGSNQISNNPGTIYGGFDNRITATAGVILGGISNRVTAESNVIGGGGQNIADGQNNGVIGGGRSNQVQRTRAVVLGGISNTTNADYGITFGGESNSTSNTSNITGGGQSNTVSGWDPTGLLGGQSNTVSGNRSFALGGQSNTVSGQRSVVLGGRLTTVSGDQIAAFNGGATAVTYSTSNTFLAMNVDVWLANNANQTSRLRLYENYGSAGVFPASVNYAAFRAPQSTFDELNNTYTLPSSNGAVGNLFTVTGTPTTTAATVAWSAPPSDYTVTAATITANNQNVNPAATQMLRITSDNNPNLRRITLSDGTTNGQVITIRVLSNAPGTNPGRGVRLQDADANIVLALANNVDLDHNDVLTMVWDSTEAAWIEVERIVNP